MNIKRGAPSPPQKLKHRGTQMNKKKSNQIITCSYTKTTKSSQWKAVPPLPYALFMSHFGRRLAIMSSLVPTASAGRRLTRYVPARIFCWRVAETADRALRILPASLPVPLSFLKRGGGTKSRLVNVPDLRRACGLGITMSSSNAEASGVCARGPGWYGRKPPLGVSGRPARRSLIPLAGANSMAVKRESSVNM